MFGVVSILVFFRDFIFWLLHVEAVTLLFLANWCVVYKAA